MNADRLLKLAAFLETMPEEKFDFATIAQEGGKPMLEALTAGRIKCGTVGCAIGWMPAIWPDEFHWEVAGVGTLGVTDGKDNWNFQAAAEFFEISLREADYLFMPGVSDLDEFAKPTEVAANIREFVARGGEV